MIGRTPLGVHPMSKVTRLFPLTGPEAQSEATATDTQSAPVSAPEAPPQPSGLSAGWLASLTPAALEGDDMDPDVVEEPGPQEPAAADEGSPGAAARPVKFAAVADSPAAPSTKEDPAPVSASAPASGAVMDQLVAQMRQFDAAALADEDATVRSKAEQSWQRLLDHALRVDRAYDGVTEAAKQHLPSRLAKELAGVLNAADAHRTAAAERSLGGGAGGHRGHGGGHDGGGISAAFDSLIRSPVTLVQAGGSAMLDGLRKAHSVANDALGRRRQTAYDVLARQVKSVASDIEADAQWLRAHGLEQVVDEIKASGMTPSDAVAEMERGGKLERLGFQAKGVLGEPDVMDRMSSMNDKLKTLSEKSQRLVKAGQVADRDAEQVVEPAMKQVQDALEGMPEVGKDGKFKVLNDKVQEIVDKLRELIERVMNKILPGR